MLSKIKVAPGINRDTTSYANSGGWFDSDFVRFRNGLPEKIGGWTRVYANQTALIGQCRKMYDWSTLVGTPLLALPTNIKFYVDNSSEIIEITPIRRSVTLGSNPIATTNGSNVIVMTDVNHGAVIGDYITVSGATTVDGITDNLLNSQHVITEVIDANAYSFIVSANATSTATGGGSNVAVAYQFHPGVSSTYSFAGWGSGAWGGATTPLYTGFLSGGIATNTASNTTIGGIDKTTITITTTSNHGGAAGDWLVLTGPTSVGGVPSYYLSQAMEVLTTPSGTTLTARVNGTALSNTSGGGTPKIEIYSANPQLGWGYGPDTTLSTYYSGLWTVDNYGEDMIACPRDLTNYINLGNNPISTTSGSNVVTVTQINHGYTSNTAIIISGVTNSIGGLTPTQLNGTKIISVVNANAYTFTATSNASSSASGGTDASVYISSIVYWDVTDMDGPAISLSNMGSVYAKEYLPYVATEILISDQNRQVIAFGCNPFDVNQGQDKMIVRWSDSNDPTNWNASDTTKTAGEQRLSSGSYIVTALQNREEVLIWTDASLFTMTYVGPPYGYGFNLVGSNFDIIGPNSKTIAGSVAYWMGSNNFYMYDGKIQSMPCTVRDYVFLDISIEDGDKVYCSSDSGNNEIIWFYPTERQLSQIMSIYGLSSLEAAERYLAENPSAAIPPGQREVDRYVVYNYVEQVWYYGSLARTSWLDRRTHSNPRAVSPDGYLYNQESGFDDGSVEPALPINAYIQSSPIEIDEGNNFLFINRVIPDITFRNSTTHNGTEQPSVRFTIRPQDYPGSVIGAGDERTVTRNAAATLNVNIFTNQLNTRLRARSVALRVESDENGVAWRLGTPRFDLRQDGRR